MILYTDQLQRANADDPIVDSTDVKGGLWTVDSVEELENISSSKLKEGMLAYVRSLDLYYLHKDGEWQKASFNSSGIPLYTTELLEQLTTHPEDYIWIRDIEELGTVTDNTYTTTINGNYFDVLFSAIRALQSEVARLKNSFKYGINSYVEDQTAMSNVMGNIEIEDEEPLWAVEEDSLSEFLPGTVLMSYEHQLNPAVNVKSDDELGTLTITDSAAFHDPKDGFKVIKDPKCFIFVTTDDLNIQFKLKDSQNNELLVDLSLLGVAPVDLYNVLFVLSKKTTKTEDDPTLYGRNFVWIQITNAKTNTVLKSGYYDTKELLYAVYDLDSEYHIDAVYFTNLVLSKFNAYTRAQDFSYEVIPSVPQELDYKFGAAHLTIRSVSTQEKLNTLTNLLLNNELIWVEENKSLCIKSKGKIYTIGGNKNNSGETMTEEQLIATLENLGIIVTGQPGDYTLELAKLTGITFINEDTNKAFDISVDAYGNLKSTPVATNLLKDRVERVTLSDTQYRGFISKLRIAEKAKADPTQEVSKLEGSDVGLLSDRLKIGAIYAPNVGRTTYGCSHAYIELENTSDQDITLNGCYLHVAVPGIQNKELHSLPLKGVIKAGSTFLIRGKQYANFTDVNTVIKVENYDQEWYVGGQLLDLQKANLAIMLMYDTPTMDLNSEYISNVKVGNTTYLVVPSNFIDGAYVRDRTTPWVKSGVFLINDSTTTRDYVLKNTFELDPAKQAFLAIHPKDSSRLRCANANDFKPFFIDTPIISFPNSDPTYDVSLITPKASFENKNIATDKTKLDNNRPNMVYCTFGINMHKTRCFNWISVGSFAEYLWVRKKGETNWSRFESYKTITTKNTELNSENIYRKEFDPVINNAVYARMQGRFPGDGSFYTAHKCIIQLASSSKATYEYVVGRADINGNPDSLHTSDILTFVIYPENTEPRVYHITDLQGFYWMEYLTWAGAAKALAEKIKNDIDSEGIMPVIINTGDVTQNGTRVNEWLDYYLAGYDLFKQYEHMSVVGNNDLCGTDPSILGTGDDVGKSNSYYHHLFNCYEIDTTALVVNGKYVPSVYYFECKTSSSKYVRFINVNSEITFINCRDWFGLKKTDDEAYNIYTGWLVGNSKAVTTPEYANIPGFVPIYNTLYEWFKVSNREFIPSCHEIPFTVMTRQNLGVSATEIGYTLASRSVDGKTGGALVGSHLNLLTKNDNTCMYWFSRLLEHAKVRICLGGHKHTYTCTYPVREFYFYLEGTKNSLVDGPMEMKADLSDEYSNGKHKVTWEYTKNDTTLFNDVSSNTFKYEATTSTQTSGFSAYINRGVKFNTSRLPIVQYPGEMHIRKVSFSGEKSDRSVADYTNATISSEYLPAIGHSADPHQGVVYFMCQATGYKQTSNKELPGVAQAFTLLLPLTLYNSTTKKDTASSELQVPMFGILKFKSGRLDLQLARIMGIQYNKKVPLYNDVNKYSTSAPVIEYVDCSATGTTEEDKYVSARFGNWKTTESNIISI